MKEENNSDFNKFVDCVVQDIIKEINSKDYISIIIDLLALIKSNCILSSKILKKLLEIIPFKYITIKKKNIWYKSQEPFTRSFNYYLSDINIESQKKEIEEESLNNAIGIETINENLDNKIGNDINNDKIEINKIKVHKKTSNLLRSYFINEDKDLTKLINEYYHLEEFPDDIITQKNFEENKKISKNIYNEFAIDNDKISIFLNVIPKTNKITVYKIDFLYPYMEIIFMKIIYQYIYDKRINLNKILEPGAIDGIFELIVIYHLLTKRKIFEFEIEDYITIESIVPNNYSIKYFSYNRNKKEKKYDYNLEDFFSNNNNNEKKLRNKCIFIKQENFNGKYYDCGLLVPVDINDTNKVIKDFYLILFQISIFKDKSKRLTKYEHEINFYYIKNNIESKYRLNIIAGYFYYILRAENGVIIDKSILKENSGICLGFDIINGFLGEDKINLISEKGCVTKNFVFHNEATLLKNENNLSALKKINRMKNSPLEKVEEKYFYY